MNKSLILVVEDDTSVRNLITTTLQAHEYRYLTAPNGQSAILEASSHNPDIVLLDLGLPDMDGVEAIRQIKFVTSGTDGTVFFGVSATVDAQVKELFDKAGATDVLRKPVKKE